MVKDYLKSKNVTFTEYDVASDNKAAMEMIHKSGQSGVPVIDIGGEIVVGFDQDSIEQILGL